MGFMKPEYREGLWLEVLEADGGITYIPADLFTRIPDEAALEPYIRGISNALDEHDPTTLYNVVRGVGGRLSAPGFLDATDWFVVATKEQARNYLSQTYDVDPDTGTPLPEETEDAGTDSESA